MHSLKSLAVMNELKTRKLKFFLGGSKRFGYDDKYSDTDLFVMGENSDDVTDMVHWCIEHGFKINAVAGYAASEGVVGVQLRLYDDVDAIHLTFMGSAVQYYVLSASHKSLESMVQMQPLVLAELRRLKYGGCSGTYIYKAMECFYGKYLDLIRMSFI